MKISLHSTGLVYSKNPDSKTYQICTVEDLNFSDLITTGIGDIAVVIVDGESTQTLWIRRGVSYRVKDLHITDVVNI